RHPRRDHNPEALMTSARCNQPREHQRDRVGGDGEDPRVIERQSARRKRALWFVDAIDVEVVNLIEGVGRRVEDRGHHESDNRVQQQVAAPRLAGRSAGRSCRAGRKPECGRNQREWPRELDEERRLALTHHWNAWTRKIAVRAAIAVLAKFRTSLLTMPSASRVAPSTLSANEPIVAPMTTTGNVDTGIRCTAAPIAASATAPRTPATVPPAEIAPDVPGGTRASVGRSHVRRPQALPISLATVSLPPAASAVTNARRDGSPAYVSALSIAAMVATPVFAIALPTPRRPP